MNVFQPSKMKSLVCHLWGGCFILKCYPQTSVVGWFIFLGLHDGKVILKRGLKMLPLKTLSDSHFNINLL